MDPKENPLNFNLKFRAQCFLAYVLGDLRSAIEVFHHHTVSAQADGQTESAALKIARKKSTSGVFSAGVGGAGFLVFWGIDARLIVGRLPLAATAWFALGLAAAIMFAWHYYIVREPDGWRLAWYRFSGNPVIDDLVDAQIPRPLALPLRRWKGLVRAAGAFGALLLLTGMLAARFAPLAWSSPWYWAALADIGLAVYWPVVYLAAINQAYHHMCAARMLGG